MAANLSTCKNCSKDVSPQYRNIGGPGGTVQDGYLHAETGKQKCADGINIAQVAEEGNDENEQGESE